MAYFTVDTSTTISRKLSEIPDNFLFSSIVLMELMVSAKDDSDRRMYERLHREYAKDNSLIVPTYEDWLMASKILYWLAHGRKKGSHGKFPRLKPGASQRMALDALIAVSARRWGTTTFTDNWDDFKSIQKYCKVKIFKASVFFKH
ncbi:MAG: hypothetical protein ACT4O9_07460 [Blastocatellia bacterium]